MASQETVNVCTSGNGCSYESIQTILENNYVDPEQCSCNCDWVPLALTTVEYPKGDLIGKFLALISLLPFSIISGFVALILFRRDLHTISFFIGTMFNEIANLILKHLIQQPRPLSRSNLYTEYGMPSSHSQFMWFFTVYSIYFIFVKLQHINSSRSSLETVWRAVLTAGCVTAACLVTYSRVYLEYHSWSQVFWGAFVGALNATFWFAFTYLVFTPLYPKVASWKLSEFLLLRDTTLIPNVLWFEYTNSRQEARARARKMVSMKSQ